jgi:hypothetical protein
LHREEGTSTLASWRSSRRLSSNSSSSSSKEEGITAKEGKEEGMEGTVAVTAGRGGSVASVYVTKRVVLSIEARSGEKGRKYEFGKKENARFRFSCFERTPDRLAYVS